MTLGFRADGNPVKLKQTQDRKEYNQDSYVVMGESMSASIKSLGLDQLQTDEKVALINELWADVVADEQTRPISEELAAELDRRIASYEANPDDVYTLEQVMTKLREDRDR